MQPLKGLTIVTLEHAIAAPLALAACAKRSSGVPVRVQFLGSDPACMADNAAHVATLGALARRDQPLAVTGLVKRDDRSPLGFELDVRGLSVFARREPPDSQVPLQEIIDAVQGAHVRYARQVEVTVDGVGKCGADRNLTDMLLLPGSG